MTDERIGEVATLAGGCFWCLEAPFRRLKGVGEVVSGYMGGHTLNPDYKQLCTGTTGHAEVIQVHFDPAIISYEDLLEIFFVLHDPTTSNRQGNDIGTQYRSAVFYHSEAQRTVAEQMVITMAEYWPNPIVTVIQPAEKFYPAEEYHQRYFDRNPSQPYCMAVVAPKIAKLRAKFALRLKESDG
ncbi:MAG: peptide-methionine (S)-S-oxide reductase MsrA [Methylophilaceae bacterium]